MKKALNVSLNFHVVLVRISSQSSPVAILSLPNTSYNEDRSGNANQPIDVT